MGRQKVTVKARRETRKESRSKGRNAGEVISMYPEDHDDNRIGMLKEKYDRTPLAPRNENQALYLDALRTRLVTIATGEAGTGKAQVLSAKIRVPGGWKRMGDMAVGDTVVTPSGDTATVTGVFPQGVTEVYRVTFADGRFTDVNPEHLWKIHDIAGPKTNRRGGNSKEDIRTIEESRENRWRVVNTREIKTLLDIPHRAQRLFVPLTKSENNNDIELPINPYVLGVILGDGGITNSNITICKPGDFIINKVASLLPENIICVPRDEMTFCIRNEIKMGENPLREYLNDVGLMGLKSENKFIPNEYFEGSTKQRLELLQGLLDTDGTVGSNHCISFSSSSEALARGVGYLIHSLGGIASLSIKYPYFTYKGMRKAGLSSWNVNIRFPDPTILFTIPHKKSRATPTQYSDTLKLRIKSIEEIEPEETQCIMIDHPEHLYVTDDFIVTHNTFLSTAHAADQLLNKEVESIIVTRPVLTAEEEMGFLPGDMMEKFMPFFRPVYDVLKRRLGIGFLRYCLRPEIEKIEIAPFSYMRGRTFDNAVVILDEAQNVTVTQMKLFLTRIGENTTVIINGDVLQCDLPSHKESGLVDLLRRIETKEVDVPVIKFSRSDCVRSDVCALALAIYE